MTASPKNAASEIRYPDGHGPVMTGAGTPPFCKCGWMNWNREGPILADHLAQVAVTDLFRRQEDQP